MVLTQVAAGDLSLRVRTNEAPDSPVGALAHGINGIIEAWRESESKARTTKRALEAKLGTIETQAAAIRELSTPIMDISEDILLLSIVGILDTRRSADVMNNLLSAIGARCVLTGLSPAIAQTLVEIGTDLSEVTTLRSLREGSGIVLRAFARGSTKIS